LLAESLIYLLAAVIAVPLERLIQTSKDTLNKLEALLGRDKSNN